MLLPDVTEIINDPDLGGGVSFQVRRIVNTRTVAGVSQAVQTIDLTGNIQPTDMAARPSTAEDVLSEGIVVRALFAFSTGINDGGVTFTGPDEILYLNKTYRVTQVDDWAQWGFTTAYAERVMEIESE